ncbi:MAG: DNA-binding protein [Lachnospiraceae bacterium]
MIYFFVKAASEKWGISERRIQKLCEENRIDGTLKFGRAWMLPKDAVKPVDRRRKKH